MNVLSLIRWSENTSYGGVHVTCRPDSG